MDKPKLSTEERLDRIERLLAYHMPGPLPGVDNITRQLNKDLEGMIPNLIRICSPAYPMEPKT